MGTDYIYGIHAVEKFITHSPVQGIELLTVERRNNQRLRSIIKQASQAGIAVRFTNQEALNKAAKSNKHQSCVLQIKVIHKPLKTLEQCLTEINKTSLFLVLDGVQDPHNLGACLRTADATNVDAVIIPKNRSAKLNAAVRKVAAGGAESVPLIEVTNLTRCLQQLKQSGVWIYGTGSHANHSLYAFDYQTAVALVVGSEATGLRRLTAEQCDYQVGLPMYGGVESLNVSVAVGVCLYEILRARTACGKTTAPVESALR